MKSQMKNTIALVIFLVVIFPWNTFALPAKDVQPIPQREYSETLHELFSHAQNSIRAILFTIRYYPKTKQSSVNRLVDDLISAAQRGVSVEVILEDSLDHAKENADENRQVGERLEKGGIKVYYDLPAVTTHDKLLVIDSRYVVIGSTNWSYYAFERNNEASVLIDSEELAQYYHKYFESLKD